MGSMALNWRRFLLMSMMINRPSYFIYSVYGAKLTQIPMKIPSANLNGLLRVCGPSNPVNRRSLVMATGIREDKRSLRDVSTGQIREPTGTSHYQITMQPGV